MGRAAARIIFERGLAPAAAHRASTFEPARTSELDEHAWSTAVERARWGSERDARPDRINHENAHTHTQTLGILTNQGAVGGSLCVSAVFPHTRSTHRTLSNTSTVARLCGAHVDVRTNACTCACACTCTRARVTTDMAMAVTSEFVLEWFDGWHKLMSTLRSWCAFTNPGRHGRGRCTHARALRVVPRQRLGERARKPSARERPSHKGCVRSCAAPQSSGEPRARLRRRRPSDTQRIIVTCVAGCEVPHFFFYAHAYTRGRTRRAKSERRPSKASE